MKASYDKENKVDILELLKDYPVLKMQYLFLNCFVISSDDILFLYKKAQENIKILNNIETYYTPEYLYKIKKDDPIFEIINKQVNKTYYYLKEHIFYYQYLLRCLKVKNDKENKGAIDTLNISEISYRTLLNRLYLLYDNINSNDNYGISEIFGVPCIYSTIESDVIEQIINMKKFSFNLMKMNKDKVTELFGINKDIDNQNYLYNQLLISISERNSSISGTNKINDDKNEVLNKINKVAIELEKFLINFSSELFLFYYITGQFAKDQLIQLPRMIFFCCMYDTQCKNIYQIQEEEAKKKISQLEKKREEQRIYQRKEEEEEKGIRKEKREGGGKEKSQKKMKKEGIVESQGKGIYIKKMNKARAEQKKIKGENSVQKKGKEIEVSQKKVTESEKGQNKIRSYGVNHKNIIGVGKGQKKVEGKKVIQKKVTITDSGKGHEKKIGIATNQKKIPVVGIYHRIITGRIKVQKKIKEVRLDQRNIREENQKQSNRKGIENQEQKKGKEKKFSEKEEKLIQKKGEGKRLEKGKIGGAKNVQLKGKGNGHYKLKVEEDYFKEKRNEQGEGEGEGEGEGKRKEKGLTELKEGKEGKEEKGKKKEKQIESFKKLLKCELINFCGILELDGAFIYKGNGTEIKGNSLVIILSEYLNQNNNNIKIYAQKYEAKNIIQNMRKYKNNIDSYKFKNYNTININNLKNDIGNSLNKLQEMADKEIISDKKIFIDKNDLILIENKREYPHHITNEIRNFIEYSFYFIRLYENLKILRPKVKIHLLFVYDHYRNYRDEGEAVVELYKIIKENSEKLKIFPNLIKFYLVHSLPRLNISIFNKLENNINKLTSQMEEQKVINNKLMDKINELEKKMEEKSHESKQKSNNQTQ